jgi:hypothetical protein
LRVKEEAMSRLLITLALAVSLGLTGCMAKTEEIKSYHETMAATNTQVLAIVERQTDAARANRNASMSYFSQAMVAAAQTENPTDDAVIAFAWGFASGKPEYLEIPSLQYPEAPVTDVDRVLAWTPLITTALPFIPPLFAGGYGNSGTQITASDQATIMIDSGNAGSYNKVSGAGAGGGIGDSTVLNKHDDLVIYNEGGGDLGEVLPTNAPVQLPEEGETPDGPDPGEGLCTEDNAYVNPVTGRTYTDSTQTCSCGSRAAGEC